MTLVQAAARWPLLSVETAKQFAAETGPVLLLSDLDLAVTTNFSGLLSLTGFRVNVAYIWGLNSFVSAATEG